MAYLLILLTPVFFVIATSLNLRRLFPLACALPAFAAYWLEIPRGEFRAFQILVVWSMVQSIIVLWTTLRNPTKMESLVWRGKEYTEGMFHWIRTAQLPEGNTRSVITFHLKQSALYCLLAILSANLFSLVLGCALLNYMNFYVARLALASRSRVRAMVMGWNPWSILRVAAFLLLGAVLGAPLALVLQGSAVQFSVPGLIAGLAGAILDVILKVALSRQWSRLLKEGLASF